MGSGGEVAHLQQAGGDMGMQGASGLVETGHEWAESSKACVDGAVWAREEQEVVLQYPKAVVRESAVVAVHRGGLQCGTGGGSWR
jgi:hypothetical protein